MKAKNVEFEINVGTKDFEKKLKDLNNALVEFGKKIEDINNTEIVINIVEKIPKKWYQFWIKTT